jgi:hypothetical protein
MSRLAHLCIPICFLSPNHHPPSLQVYLKEWARECGAVVVSVDYSLAPEFPYPTASLECYAAYAWALNNLQRLGSVGEGALQCSSTYFSFSRAVVQIRLSPLVCLSPRLTPNAL